MKEKAPRKKFSLFSIGYKKPPKETQFKPGVSGNPKGRPKKVKQEELIAKQWMDLYDSLVMKGFSRSQALDICKLVLVK